MDRRMLLAMVLAILVLFINTLVFAPKHKDVPPPAKTTEQVAEAPVKASEITPRQDAVHPVLPPGMEMILDRTAAPDTTGTILVQTRSIIAEFDPWGFPPFLEALEIHGCRGPRGGSRPNGRHWGALVHTEGWKQADPDRLDPLPANRHALRRIPTIRFVAEDPSGISVEKAYTIPAEGYLCRLEVTVRGMGEDSDGAGWEIGWLDGLPLLEKDPRTDRMAISSVALFGKEFIRTHAGGGQFGCAGRSGGVKKEENNGTLRWMGVRNRYFLGALILDPPQDRRIVTSWDGDSGTAGATMFEPLSMSGTTRQEYGLYLGPIHYGTLENLKVGLERVQDLGPGVLRPFSKLLMKFFLELNKIVPNYGLEILILSILIRLLFYPLTKKSMDSMKRMQQLKPEMDRINERFKGDPERKNKEVLELYRTNKINPLGGCLPVLVQLPVLSGLYFVLANAVQLRKEPFGLWIHDLSAPDTVAHLAGFPVNPMPLIMAGTMFWQQKITPTDPRQASLGYIMPIFMTFLFYSTPSGLVLYWTVSNLMTVLQQIWMNRSGTQAPVLVASSEPPARSKH